MQLQSCDGQGKAWKDRRLWVFFREKFCNYLALIIVWHFWVFYRSALTEPKAFGGENKLPHRQKNRCNSPGEFALSKKPMEKDPITLSSSWEQGEQNWSLLWRWLYLGIVSLQDCMNHESQTAKSTVNIPAPSICPCRCTGEPHLLPPPHPQSCPAASWDLSGINELGSLEDLASSRNSHTRCCDKTSHQPQSNQALTAALGHVSDSVPSYKGSSSSLSPSPPHLSGSLRYNNGPVTNTFTFSVLLPPVQISITQSDKEKMKLQSVRLQVFSPVIGAVFKTL